MTKLTKNEKILRKGNEKWKNFLAEGGFKQVNENNPPKASDGFYIHLKRTPLRVVRGSLKGAEGKAIEFTTTTKGEPAIVIELTKSADQRVFGQVSDEVIVLPGDVETIGTDMADDPKMDYYNDMPSRSGEAMQEYGDHETQAQGGMVSSTQSSDPEMDQVADIAATVVEQGGFLMQIATALKDQGFDASLQAGVLMIDDKYFIGKPAKFDIGPDEPVQEVGPYVVGMMDNQMKEGMGGETGEDWDDLLSQIMNASPDADAAEMAERAADLVDAGNIDAATDLIADIINNTSDPDTSETAEKAYDAVEALQMNEARMGEYGKMDAEQGLPPTKIGRGNEEYMAAYNAVLVARGEEPLDIQQPDQAFLDALRSGQLQEAVDKRARQLLSEGLTPEQVKEKILEEGLGDFIRKGIDTVKKKTGLGKSMATRDSMESLRSLGFEFNEMLEEYLPTPEEIKVMSDVFADYGRSSAGGSSKDPLRQAFSKLPKLKQKVLMNPSILRKQVKTFEKKAYEIYDNIQRSGDKTAKKASKAGRALIEEIEGMIPFAKSLRQAFEEARKTGNAEGAKQLADQKAREHRALMKQIDANTRASAAADREAGRQAKRDARRRDDKEQDIVRGKSTQRFGMATNLEENEKKKFKLKESNMEMRLQSKAKGKAMGLLQTAKAMAKAPSTEPARGFAAAVSKAAGEIVDLMVELEGFQASRSASLQEGDMTRASWMRQFMQRMGVTPESMDEFMKDNAMHAYRQGMSPKRAAEELRKADAERDFPESGMELYDIDEKKNLKEEVIEDFEIELEGGLTFADVEEAGLVTPGVDSVIDNGDGYAQVYSEPGAMAKMAKTLEAMTGVMVSPKSHGPVDEEMSKKDFVRMVRDKDKVPNLKGDMGPISGLEGPFQYRSGAVLYYDPKAGKYYDRGRDMYLDDDEASSLIMEKDEKEFAKVKAIATDMMVLSARSRIKPTLGSVQSALDVQKIPSQMEGNKLIVADKYVVAEKNVLPETAESLSFTRYAIDYLSNLPGEQQDLPLG